ncbi:hypothetical protein J1F00_05990 [Stenotrophomonas maltophilia]|nr:hypothetical protein [Stenotrophomonas maltophilia]
MFVLFASHMIRKDHVSAISLPFDTGAEGSSHRFRVAVYLLGGSTIEGSFSNEADAKQQYQAFKGAVET